MRYFLGVDKFAPNAAILADMGWIKLFYTCNRYLCIITYWNRLLNMPENCLTKQIFEQDYRKCSKNE